MLEDVIPVTISTKSPCKGCALGFGRDERWTYRLEQGAYLIFEEHERIGSVTIKSDAEHMCSLLNFAEKVRIQAREVKLR